MHILQSSCERTQEDFFVLTLKFRGKFLEDMFFFHNFTSSLHAEGTMPYIVFNLRCMCLGQDCGHGDGVQSQ